MQNEMNKWSSASLHITSMEMSLKDICAQFSVQPTRWYKKGEHCVKGNPKSRIRDVNAWVLESALSDQEPLDSHIEHLLDIVEKEREAIIRLLPTCKLTFCCAYFSVNGQGGFTLDSEILKALTLYPIDLSINLYPPCGKDQD